MATRQIVVTGDDKDELIAALKEWLEDLEGTPEETVEEETAEEEVAEEPAEEEAEVEVEEEADPMQELRDKLVERIRAMSKKPELINKLREAFKKNGIKKFDDNTPDKKLPALAKSLGVK